MSVGEWPFHTAIINKFATVSLHACNGRFTFGNRRAPVTEMELPPESRSGSKFPLGPLESSIDPDGKQKHMGKQEARNSSDFKVALEREASPCFMSLGTLHGQVGGKCRQA